MKVPERLSDNAIIIRRLDALTSLRNMSNIDKLIYVSSEELAVIEDSYESMLDSVLSCNSISSLFSSASELEETLAVITQINSEDIKNMFN